MYAIRSYYGAFRLVFPEVSLQIHQGTPQELVEMAINDRVDFSVCTEELGEHSRNNFV